MHPGRNSETGANVDERERGGKSSFQLEPDRGPPASAQALGPEGAVEAPPALAAPGSGATEDGKSVLIVDDDATLTTMLTTVMERNGFVVLTAADGHAALATIERDGPSVVLADVWMPQMSGYELVERMIDRGDRIPVVLMSGIVPESRFPRLRFLRKPFRITEVVEAVNAALAEPLS